MKNQFLLLTLISILLIACSPQVTVTSEVTVTLQSPMETPIPMPTDVPLEALPVKELVQKYLAGEIDDISFLTLEQRNAFSLALAERVCENSPIVSFNNNEAYLNAVDLQMYEYNDGTTPEQKRFPLVSAIEIDGEGNIYQIGHNGERQLIAGIKYDELNGSMVVTDPSLEGKITPPTTDTIDDTGLTQPQILLSEHTSYQNGFFTDAILNTNIIGTIHIDHDGRGKLSEFNVLSAGKFIYDSNGKPILIQNMIIFADKSLLRVYKEGSDFYDVFSRNIATSQFKQLADNQFIFLGAEGVSDQALIDSNPDWRGLALHDQRVVQLLQEGKIITDAVPLISAPFLVLSDGN